eukprot:GHUV01012025.1.p1 GENE.GHUV01012025.1~~GHUV01012025.1.p1  ORF type:complete len:534 (+),score=238.87 GHUV01012025.1:496-2097(+)
MSRGRSMELTIKSLRGSSMLTVDGNNTVADVKDMLHKQNQDWAVPQQQRLVHKQGQLPNEAMLEQAGISGGDQLVLLEARPRQKPQAPKVTPVPDAAAIRAAITEEARRRGIEHTLKEERHPTAQQRRNMALPRQLLSSLGGVDDQLVQLLEQALDGQFNLANLRLSGSGEPHTEEEEEGEEQEIQPPEPQAAHIAQLTDMGFAEAVASKALILTRDNVQLAVEWLFEHGEDPNAADPPTQEQLRQVYGRRRGRRRHAAAAPRSAAGSTAATPTAAAAQANNNGGGAAAAGPPPVPMEVVLAQLSDMGFDAAAAGQALARVGPNLDLAVGMLLGQGLSAAIAMERGGASGQSSSSGQQQDSSAGGSSAAAAGEGHNGRDAAARGGDDAADDDAAFESAEEDDDSHHDGQEEEDQEYDDDEYEDEEEDEYVDYDDEDEEGHFPLQALAGTMGSMDLNELGSADMEQLLQGAAIQDLYGSQLLMAGGIEGGMGGGGPQGSLLRLMEAPVLLQQMVTALQEPQQQQQGGEHDEAAF